MSGSSGLPREIGVRKAGAHRAVMAGVGVILGTESSDFRSARDLSLQDWDGLEGDR